MEKSKMDLNPDPRSTWGATEAYRKAWNEKYGKAAESEKSNETPNVDSSSSDVSGAEGNRPNDPLKSTAPLR